MPVSEAEIDQVTDAVVGEALGEGRAGWSAVAHSIANRVDDSRYPGTVTGVLAETTGRRGYNAYSTFNDPAREGTQSLVGRINPEQRAAVRSVVEGVFDGSIPDPTLGATSYYNPQGRHSAWHENQGLTATIGNHSFYGQTVGAPTSGIRGTSTSDPFAGYPSSPIDASYQHANPATGMPDFSTLSRPTIDNEPVSYQARGIAPTPTARADPSTTPSLAQSGILDTVSRQAAVSPNYTSLSPSTPSYNTPTSIQSAPTDIAPTPMSRAQTVGTPASSLGTPTGRIDGVTGITGVAQQPAATTTAPSFNPVPAADLAAYQQYARSRLSAPAITPTTPVTEPTAPATVSPVQQIAAAITQVAPAIGSILGRVNVPGILSGITAGPSNAARGTDANYNPSYAQAQAQSNITADSMRSHTTPSGATNFSGMSSSMPGWGAVTNSSGVTTMSDPTSGVSATSGAGGEGGKVLCTHYNSIGWLDDKIYTHDALYALTVDAQTVAGYHRWAIPLVDVLSRHKWLERAVWPFVNVWAHSMHHPEKLWSKLLRWTGETICKSIAPKRKPAHG